MPLLLARTTTPINTRWSGAEGLVTVNAPFFPSHRTSPAEYPTERSIPSTYPRVTIGPFCAEAMLVAATPIVFDDVVSEVLSASFTDA